MGASRSKNLWSQTIRRAVIAAVAMLTVAGCTRGPSPLPIESLQIRINLLCTTCDDFLRCTRSTDSPRGDVYVLFRLREKSFWAQIATIWDYLIQWVHRKTTDTRPLTVYENRAAVRRVLFEGSVARVDAANGIITFNDSTVDMRSGEWRSLAGVAQGSCVTLKRREGYAWVRGMLGRELPSRVEP